MSLKFLKPAIRKEILKNAEPEDVYLLKAKKYFFNYQLAKSGMQIKGNNSNRYYMNARMKYWNVKGLKSLSDDSAFFYEENFRFDWLTEFMNLQEFLLNPHIMQNRYVSLSYDEIRKKNFLIVSMRVVDSKKRQFKQQSVRYSLYHRNRPFPSGAIVVDSLPKGISIRLDQKRNVIGLEGPGVWGPAYKFLVDVG